MLAEAEALRWWAAQPTNGGEMLCLALATCYCSDLYREAAKRSIEVIGVEVQASAEFGPEGLPASRLSYRV